MCVCVCVHEGQYAGRQGKVCAHGMCCRLFPTRTRVTALTTCPSTGLVAATDGQANVTLYRFTPASSLSGLRKDGSPSSRALPEFICRFQVGTLGYIGVVSEEHCSGGNLDVSSSCHLHIP